MISISKNEAMAWAILLLIAVSPLAQCRPSENRCSPCPSGGCPVPTDCLHGIYLDACGRSSCAKGPGERCKTRRFRFFSQENCGEGMYCHCGRCMGCSLSTYNCFEDTCVFPMGSG